MGGNKIEYGYNMGIYQDTGLKIPITHELESHCHLLLTGASGSGKSYALLYLLGSVLKSHKDIELYFCDFKNSSDFEFLKGHSHYYGGNDCYKGITEYYNAFSKSREERDFSRKHLLIVDEYPALINYLQGQDKANKTRLASDILSAISEILCLGRGIQFYTWIVTQRADNTLFSNGCRDNFMVIIGLGRMSKEQRGMLFSGEEIPERIYKRGEGILLADGSPLIEVKFPFIKDIDDWKRHILKELQDRPSQRG